MQGSGYLPKRREDSRRHRRGSWKPAGYRFRAPGCHAPVRGYLATRQYARHQVHRLSSGLDSGERASAVLVIAEDTKMKNVTPCDRDEWPPGKAPYCDT